MQLTTSNSEHACAANDAAPAGLDNNWRQPMEMAPFRVLQLISSGGQYGAENMLLALAAQLQRDECHTVVGVFCNLHRPNTQVLAGAAEMGLVTEVIECKARIDLGAVGRIRRVIRKHGITVLHTHGYKADLYGYLAARGEAVPIMATCHNWPGKSLSLRVYSFLDRLVLRRFPVVAAVSENVVAKLRSFRVDEGRIRLVPNGIPVETFRRAQPKLRDELGAPARKIIGAVGRLDVQKGFQDLLRAAATVLKSFPDALFVIVGEGPYRSELEQLARNLQIEQNVHFTGQRQDMPEVYASFDVFVLPSFVEAMPLTILEAMAAARPVIATRVGAIPDVVTDGQAGLLVAPGEASELARTIVRVLSEPGLSSRLAACAEDRAARLFSAEAMARNYRELYEGLLERRGSDQRRANVTQG